MLSFELPEEIEILRKSVRDFAENEIKPRAKELDEKEEFSIELTKKMGELGLFGIFVPQEYGGAGMSYLALVVAVEELARVDGSQAATVAAGNSLGIAPIYYFGSEKQKKEWLPVLCTGEKLAAFGLTEPEAGSDAGASKTTAVLKDGRWLINGQKIFITNSACEMTGVIIVQARTGTRPDGKVELSCILVPSDTSGFTAISMKEKMMWRASNTGQLFFEDCKVPEENVLGQKGAGFKQMLQTLDGGRLSIGAMALGGAQGAYELALDYAKQRKQFGQSISKFQTISFKLADMATKIEAARWLLYRATWLKDNKKSFGKEAAMAKLFASEVFKEVVHDAVQIFGGYGLMKEYPIERFYRDERLLEIGEGTSEIQRLVIARRIGCYDDE